MVCCVSAFVPFAAAQSALKGEYYQSFKARQAKPPGFEFFGPDAHQCVRFEAEGLRLTLPPGQTGIRPTTGLAMDVVVKGDFEITLGFEVLQEPKPAGGRDKQTRLTLDIVLDKPGLNAASLSRTVYGKGVEFVTWSGLQDAMADKPKITMHYLPAPAKAGRLRVVRNASTLSFYGASGGKEDFALLKQHPFGAEDLKTVRVVGSTGIADATLDVRVTELRIRAQSLPNTPSPAGADGADPGRTFWWLAIGVVVMAVAGGLAVWLVLRGRRRGAPMQEPAASPSAGTTTTAVAVECPSCHKRLKLPADAAGKRVKCPACAAAFVA